MKSENEIEVKRTQIIEGLKKLEAKWFKTDSDKIQIEFHKNNIAFIEWALMDSCKCCGK